MKAVCRAVKADIADAARAVLLMLGEVGIKATLIGLLMDKTALKQRA